MLRGIFILINASIKNKKNLNNLTLQLKELEKEEQTRPKANRRKQMIRVRAEINRK